MKNKAKLFLCVLCVALLSIALLSGCKKEEPFVLGVPQNIRIENDYLMWDAVEGATEYYIIEGENRFKISETVIDLWDYASEIDKTYTFTVTSLQAIENSENYITSEASSPIEYTLTPTEGLVFNMIKNGAAYEVAAEDPETLSGRVVIPEEYDGLQVTQIAEKGFIDCKEITSILMPSSIRNISTEAFAYCEKLERMQLSKNTATIENFAFYGCKALTAFELPEDTKTVGSGIFAFCNNLTTLTVDEENTTYISEGNCIIHKKSNTVVAGCKTSVIPKKIKTIGEASFFGCQVDKIELPAGITIIEQAAFMRSSISSLELPSALKEIGVQAFQECQHLSYVAIPKTVRTIGAQAFYKTVGLTILMPESVDTIEEQAFQGENLTVYTDYQFSSEETCWPMGWLIIKDVPDIEGNPVPNITGVWCPDNFCCNCEFVYVADIPYLKSIPVTDKLSGAIVSDDPPLYMGMFVTYLYAEASFRSEQSFTAPSRDGYTFAGWATEENGPAVITPYNDTLTATTAHEEQLTLTRTFCLSENEMKQLFTDGKTKLYAVWVQA